MATIAELTCKLDGGTGDVMQIKTALTELHKSIENPEAPNTLEFSDAIFDLYPILIKAAAVDEECKNVVSQIITVAARVCSPREVFTLIQSTLSELSSSEHPESSRVSRLDRIFFQSQLLLPLATCLTRLERKVPLFVTEYMQVTLQWCKFHLQNFDDIWIVQAVLQQVEGAFDALVKNFTGKVRNQLSETDAQQAVLIVSAGLLQVIGLVMQLPTVVKSTNSTFGTMTYVFRRAMKQRLMNMKPVTTYLVSYPVTFVDLLGALVSAQSTSLNSLELLFETLPLSSANHSNFIADLEFIDQSELMIGCALALFRAITASEEEGGQRTSSLIDDLKLQCPPLDGVWLLHQVAMVAHALFKASGKHESMLLGLLQSMIVYDAAQLLKKNAASAEAVHSAADEEDSETLTDIQQIMDDLLTVMSYNPTKLLRDTAYEAWEQLLEALPQNIRWRMVRYMLHLELPAARTLALQRMRSELASFQTAEATTDRDTAILSLRVGHAVEAAAAVVVQDGRHGWQSLEHIAERADGIAAGLALIRFILLKQHEINSRSDDAKNECRAKLKPLLEKDLPVLKAAVEKKLQLLQIAANEQKLGHQSDNTGELESGSDEETDDESDDESDDDDGPLDVALENKLAVMRLQEAVSCVEAAATRCPWL